jgi:SAM-dependent methyltransferase
MSAPEFATRDPARADFWDERFAKDFIPWDARGVPPLFAQFVKSRGNTLGSRVLVPGCGSAYEVKLLDRAGFEVVAIDYAAAAVQRARAVLGADLADRCVRQADLFEFAATSPFDWIYERALLAALPPALWPRWADAVEQLLKPGGRVVGYFVIDPQLDARRRGPPFAALRAEVDALLRGFVLEECIAVPAAQSIPVFADREFWMVWRRGNKDFPSRTEPQ